MLFCRICGALLAPAEEAGMLACGVCGEKQPSFSGDENILAELVRGQSLREQGRFDEAIAVYDGILAEGEPCAEAYFSRLLCRYGVRFARVSGKWKVQVERPQAISLFADGDFRFADRYAEEPAKAWYRRLANEIDLENSRLRLEIVAQEKQASLKREGRVKKIYAAMMIFFAVFSIAFVVISAFVVPDARYQKVLSLVAGERYEEARAMIREYGCTYLDIPEGVKQIEEGAFADCDTLRSITVPASVEWIGARAFADCDNLQKITLEGGVEVLPESLFENCKSLTSVSLAEGVLRVERYAFRNCEKLATLSFPESVRAIGASALEGCVALADLTLSFGGEVADAVGVPYIGSLFGAASFRANKDFLPETLKTVTVIGEGHIPNGAFYGCNYIEEITLAEGILSVGDQAFAKCVGLLTVTLPDSLAQIGAGAFSSCEQLVEISLPSSLHQLEDSLFANCTLLSVIVFPTELLKIGDSTFSGCTSLAEVSLPATLTMIDDFAFYGCSALGQILFPPALSQIGASAFYGCAGLSELSIPAAVSAIGAYAFAECGNVQSIFVEGENSVYHSAGNCLVETATKTLLFGCQNSVIPGDGSVIALGDKAFAGCYGLESLFLPATVVKIFGYPFLGCSGLSSVVAEEGNPLYHSADHCLIETETKTLLLGCQNSAIPLDGSVACIDSYAFADCIGLKSIFLPATVRNIRPAAFFGCYGLETILVAQGNVMYYSVRNCLIETATKTVVLGCQNSIIPEDGSVTSIGEGAFYGCKTLTELEIPAGITKIEGDAFFGCTALTSVVLPDTLSHIGAAAFAECVGLAEILLPDSLIYIGDHAFEGCISLAEIVLPEFVSGIGNGVFFRCVSLNEITMYDGVTILGYVAFAECSSLKTIVFQGTKAEWEDVVKEADWDRDAGKYTVRCINGSIEGYNQQRRK